jgi:hypothetical protein
VLDRIRLLGGTTEGDRLAIRPHRDRRSGSSEAGSGFSGFWAQAKRAYDFTSNPCSLSLATTSSRFLPCIWQPSGIVIILP